MSMLVDSHCHLDFPALNDELDEVVARAGRAGVGAMVTISTRVREFEKILAVAERFPQVFCSVGLHPHDAANEPELSADRLVELAAHPKVVGIGETGLDYYYDNSPREAQREKFRVHIDAARRSGLPLIVHTRDADDDMAEILTAEKAKGDFSAVMHCFSSGRALAEKAIALGFYLSISGIVTFKSAQDLRDIVADTPRERLLVETDAPFLAPEPKRGKSNEPAFVAHTAAKVAQLHDMAPEALAQLTTENFFRLFAKAQRPRAV
jgi:TatD DNase family protein